MKRADFFKRIKKHDSLSPLYYFNLDFKNKPSKVELENGIIQTFPFILMNGDVDLFQSEPDWMFMEDNEDFEGWRYTANVNLNELFDRYIERIPEDINDRVSIYRIESQSGKGPYDTGEAFSLLKPGTSPFEDGDIRLVFSHDIPQYLKKWKFGFLDRSQIDIWLDLSDTKKIKSLKTSKLNLVEIVINKNKIVSGSDQVIFQEKDIIAKKIFPLMFSIRKKEQCDLNLIKRSHFY